MTLVHSIRGVVQWCVEAEGHFSSAKIIIDRLGHADDLHALPKKPERDLLRTIPADTDDRINSELTSIGDDFSRDVSDHFLPILHSLVMEGIATVGGAENRATTRQDAADVLECEFARFFRPDQAVEAVGN